jgi:hypothetical protein
MLTQQKVKDIINYDPLTGIFTWKVSSQRMKEGKELTSIKRTTPNAKPYYRTRIYGEHIVLHRLAFIFMLDRYPEKCVDHINGNTLDNRWNNLRECSISENNVNSKLYNTNTSGHKGISVVSSGYLAHTQFKKVRYQKYFNNKEEAITWIKNKREEIHGEFFNHGEITQLGGNIIKTKVVINNLDTIC